MIRSSSSARGLTLLRLVVVLVLAVVSILVIMRLSGSTAAKVHEAVEGTGEQHAGMPGMSPAAAGSVTLTAAQIRDFGVTFGSVEVRTLAPTLRAPGVVVVDETRLVQVTSRVSGYVERLFADFTGKPVRAGQPLYTLYSPELVAAQEELLLAARLTRDRSAAAVPGLPEGGADLIDAARRRLLLWDVPASQVEAIIGRGEVQQAVTFVSPVNGVVLEKAVLSGQAVEAGSTLYTIGDLSEVWVEVELREAEAGPIGEGVPATVEFTAFPGKPMAGEVEYVHPILQPEARTLKARIALPNPDGRIRPGMYATVRLTAPGAEALTVPNDAVVRTGERALVFIDLGGGRLQPVEIEPGRVSGNVTEVLAGVEPGQRVVTSAQYLLESESNLSEVMKAMMGQVGQAAMPGMEM